MQEFPTDFSPENFSLDEFKPANPNHLPEDFDPTKQMFKPEDLAPLPVIRKRKKIPVSDEKKNQRYWERRIRNNDAARKSREAKRIRDNQILMRAKYLEQENETLRKELEECRARNFQLRNALENQNRNYDIPQILA